MIAASRLVLSRAPLRRSAVGARRLLLVSAPSRCVVCCSRARIPSAISHGISKMAARAASTSTSGAPQVGRKSPHPERLLIYHAGTGRTTFLACLKLTTIFTFAFFVLLVTPAYLASDHPRWKAAGLFLSGVIPLVSVAYLTSPFVTMIHIRLPPFTRQSRELLTRWVRSAGTPAASGSVAASPATSSSPSTVAADAVLDITTMSHIGKPRVSSVRLADLRPARERFGVVNFARDVRAANAARPWWRFRAVGKFNAIPGGEGNVPSGWVWTEVASVIEKRAATSKTRTKATSE